MENRYRRIPKGYFGSFNSTPEIGREDSLDSSVTSAHAKFFCQHTPSLRELTVTPAGGNSLIVILAYRMCFEYDLSAHGFSLNVVRTMAVFGYIPTIVVPLARRIFERNFSLDCSALLAIWHSLSILLQ